MQVRELADFIAVEIIGQVLVFQDMVGRIQIAFAQEIARSAGGESRHGDQRRQAFEERPARHAQRAPLTPTPSPAAPGPAEKAGYGDDDQEDWQWIDCKDYASLPWAGPHGKITAMV